ncbi:hypothetical protein IMZ48_38595 [Candidatus Bathyarchaeota archaeon]|nr:hypothetical protein [Candidatus Bathyarchaeota archaeon]
MGWWDRITGSKPAEEDPFKSLDPKLRDFLQKESPVKFEPKDSEPAPPKKPTEHEPEDPEAAARARSLYQDGRYAHLWKSYTPLADVEAATKSSHEKLTDVLEGYKERKTLIGKAALENCAFEQGEWRHCMTNGSWSDALTMCRSQVRQFERCYTMQSVRFPLPFSREGKFSANAPARDSSGSWATSPHQAASNPSRRTSRSTPTPSTSA